MGRSCGLRCVFIADPVKNDAGQSVSYRPKSGILEFVQDNVKEVIDDYIRAEDKMGMKFREIQGALLRNGPAGCSEYGRLDKMWGDLSARLMTSKKD